MKFEKQDEQDEFNYRLVNDAGEHLGTFSMSHINFKPQVEEYFQQRQYIYIVASPGTEDKDEDVHAAFTTMEKAELYREYEFDLEGTSDENQPYVGMLQLDPAPVKREFATVWHTCLNIQTGEFGEKGEADRCNAECAVDREYVTGTAYNLGYINVRSRISAEDSIQRAEAYRARLLKVQKLNPSA